MYAFKSDEFQFWLRHLQPCDGGQLLYMFMSLCFLICKTGILLAPGTLELLGTSNKPVHMSPTL